MAKQNIYDNEIFFEGYKKIRENEANANNVFEIPALFSLLPDLNGKSVLDLGCGFGEHCKGFIQSGAAKVVGVDISAKMLEVAREENSDPRITYLNMAMEDIGSLEEHFDVVVSSLAFHYVEDFDGVVGMIYRLLNKDGEFIFSQEHPLNTCFTGGSRWTFDENGEKIFANVSNYCVETENESTWFVDNVKRYHRMFSTIINTLTDNGFEVKKLIEPTADEELLEKYPQFKDSRHKPDFLVVKAVKR